MSDDEWEPPPTASKTRKIDIFIVLAMTVCMIALFPKTMFALIIMLSVCVYYSKQRVRSASVWFLVKYDKYVNKAHAKRFATMLAFSLVYLFIPLEVNYKAIAMVSMFVGSFYLMHLYH